MQQKQKHSNTLLPPLAIWRLLTAKGRADGLKGSPCFLLLELLAGEPVFNPVQPLPEFQVYRGISHCSQRFSAGWFRKVQLPQFHGAPSKSSSLGWVRGVCLELFWCSKEKAKENILFQKRRIINSQDHTIWKLFPKARLIQFVKSEYLKYFTFVNSHSPVTPYNQKEHSPDCQVTDTAKGLTA